MANKTRYNNLEATANQLLAQHGYTPNGSSIKGCSKAQQTFESSIKNTPMGNKMR